MPLDVVIVHFLGDVGFVPHDSSGCLLAQHRGVVGLIGELNEGLTVFSHLLLRHMWVCILVADVHLCLQV